jgi:hypothetical protein
MMKKILPVLLMCLCVSPFLRGEDTAPAGPGPAEKSAGALPPKNAAEAPKDGAADSLPEEIRNRFADDFEGREPGTMPGLPWSGGGVVVSAEKTVKAKDRPYFGNSGNFISLSAMSLLGRGTTVMELKKFTVDRDSALSFRFRSEILSKYGQNFVVYLDGKEQGRYSGLNTIWRRETILLGPGEHTLRFELSTKGTYIQGGYNAVFLDDISLVPDETAAVILSPRGRQETYLGAPEELSLRFSAQALREDGSVRAGAAGFEFSADGGASVDETGLFSAPAAGSYRVKASLDGKTGVSGEVLVHPENFLRDPVMVAGSDKVYKGYLGGSGKIPGSDKVTFTFPETAQFEVDGFLYLEGSTRDNKGLSINVRKVVQETPLEEGEEKGFIRVIDDSLTQYRFVSGEFAFRLWLPPGKGKYIIDLGGETLEFTNVRDEGEVDGESLSLWLYPTSNARWDDYRIKNLVSDLVYGLETDEEKIRAIHDYLVKNFHYDMVGFRNAKKRTSQDALTVLKYRSGVCEGYSRITAAMMRAAGIPTKVISGRATGGLGSGGHAWNHVLVNGAWKFLDTTWDDPVPDNGPNYVRYDYYLLDSFTGVRNDHRGSVDYGE